MASTTDKREVVITVTKDALGKHVTTPQDIWKKNFGALKGGRFGQAREKASKAHFTNQALATYGMVTVARNAISTVYSQAKYSVQRNMQLVDDYVMERQTSEIINSIEVGKSIFTGAAVGAVGGAAVGPIGMLIGTVVGAGTAAWKQYNAVYQNQDQANLALAQTTYNNTYSRNRMGYALADNGVNTYN